MNRILYRIGTVVVVIITLAFLGYQVIRYLYMPEQVETAYLFTQSDYVLAQGIAVRDETVITTPANGVTSYLLDDGEKVSAGMPVAKVYSTEQDAANEAAIKKLEQEAQMLSQSADPGHADYANAEVLSSQIIDKLTHLSEVVESRSLGGLDTYKNEYLMLLNTRQVATDRVQNFDTRVAQLNQEAEGLQNSTQPSIAEVQSPTPGFFVSVTDGYEGKLTHDVVSSMTVDTFRQQLQEQAPYQPSPEVVGKIITDFEWYFAALVPMEKMGRFTRGTSITVTFPYESDVGYAAVVDSTITQEDSQDGVVLLKLNRMNKELCTLRSERAELSFMSYRGLKVRNSIMRFQGSQPGVYVKNGESIVFKKLDIIFYGDGFVLSKEHDDTKYLAQYNEMIINGKEMETVPTQ